MHYSEEIVQQRIEELRRMYEEAFTLSYGKDIQRLLKTTSQRTKRYEEFPYELDIYELTIRGLSHFRRIRWRQDMHKTTSEKLAEWRTWASCSFFEAYPHNKRLEPRITARFTPHLYKSMQHTQRMRRMALELIDILIAAREQGLLPYIAPAE